MSISKNQLKYIRSLGEKKFRNEHDAFVAEGAKLVFDLLATCRCRLIAALPSVLSSHPGLKADEIVAADESELKKATFLKTAPQIIGVFYRPRQDINEINPNDNLCLVLDGIQDPGNMGAIVRVADWFGIEHIVCSHDTADIFNPKTIQATMGAIARVKVAYTGLDGFLRRQAHLPVYGTFLEGDDLFTTTLSENGLIVMGSEGKGISGETERLINKRLFIPNFPEGRATSESLNVAAAAAITCAEFRRRRLT
jgi:TrmH family RNA methyltransferase